MTRLSAIIVKIIRELLRDIRTLVLMMLAPLVVITLMYFIFDVNNEADIRLGVPDTIDQTFVEGLPDDVEVVPYELAPTMSTLLDNDQLDAFVNITDEKIDVTYKNEDPSKTGAVKQVIRAGLEEMKDEQLKGILGALPEEAELPVMSMEETYLYGSEDSTFFDKMFPILIGFFVFFFVFLISGIALLRERTMGTMERMLATSVRRSEIIIGYLSGFGIFAMLQTIIIVLYSIYLLDMNIAGNIGWVLAINVLLALSALAIGMFISTFANTEFQMMQFIPLIIVPQIFFSGIIPLDNIADWISVIGYAFPLRYAGDALTEVMIKGNGFMYIWEDLLALAVFIAVFVVLDILGLKKYRRV